MIPDTHRREAYRRRLVVKLKPEALIEGMTEGAAKLLPGFKAGEAAALDLTGQLWGDLEQEFPGLAVERMFPSVSTPNLKGLPKAAVAPAAPVAPTDSSLLGYFTLDVAPDLIDQVLSRVVKRDDVELAYLEGAPTRPPEVQLAQVDDQPLQGYLNPAPEGIDASFAWPFSGGKGQQVQLVDVERGWDLDHQDLVGLHIGQPLSGLNGDFFGHGTSVLGIVAAPGTNPTGVVGIAPRLASVKVVSQWRRPDRYSTAAALLSAAEALNAGDVLLVEAQTTIDDNGLPIDKNGFLPVEVEPAVFDVLQLVNRWGITVVEAAGNGGRLLDDVTDVLGRRVFNRAIRDSGAILVGAALISQTPPLNHPRHPDSNFGDRIDCYGWGNGVFTAGNGEFGGGLTDHTNRFSGTSAAAAMVAGAALLVQSMAKANGLGPFSPAALRRILSDPANGTTSANPANDRIGVMPDLKKIIHNVLPAVLGPVAVP